MRTLTKVLLTGLLIILISTVTSNCVYIIRDIKGTIDLQNELQNKINIANDAVINNIYQDLKKLNNKIDKLPKQEQYNKFKLEQILKYIDIMVINVSAPGQGSGVTLKYKGKFYILTAGHMMEKDTDKLQLWENGKKVCDLLLVKHSYTDPSTIKKDEDFVNSQDLLLLKPVNSDFVPKFYAELADEEPPTGLQVYIVGNPLGIEDVISDGRLIMYIGNFVYYIDHTYFGNSGGGVYDLNGKVIGIVSHLSRFQETEDFPPYIISGAVRLNVIKEFLKDIN